MSDKVQLKPSVVGYTMPVAVLGTEIAGQPSFMAVAWLARVNARPPMMAAAVGRSHASYEAVRDHGTFSLSFPALEERVATDYVGIVSARKADKSRVFEVFRGQLEGAPMVRSCPVALECKIAQTVDLPTNTLFIGEVVSIWADPDVVDDRGAVDLAKARPLLLSMPDNRYWQVGEPVGRAWHDGQQYSPEPGEK